MALSFVDKCTGTTNCAAVPAHQSGDLFLAYAGRNSSITAPTLPAGWTSMGTQSINGTSTADSVVLLACKVALNSSETVTGFTNSASLDVHIYRGPAVLTTATCATGNGTPSFFATAINTTPTTATWNALTNATSQSWDVGFIYAPAATAGITTGPTGMTTNRSSNGAVEAGFDTNAGVASFTSTTTSWTTGSRAITAVVEIKAPTADNPTITSTSGSFTVNNNDTSFTISNGGSAVTSPTFCYRVDGVAPTTSAPGTCGAGSSTYAGAVNITATATVVKALATKAGANDSGVTTQTFTLTTATPVASPATESFAGSVSVGLTSATTGLTSLRYTTDGSAPACPATGTVYSSPISVSATTTIKSVACKTGYATGTAQSDIYTLSVPTTRTVKAGGGGDCTVIQTCVNLMNPGDTTTVFAGTYNEDVTVTAGGVASYKTLQVNTGDTVNVYSFNVDSHVKVIGFVIHHDALPTNAACVTLQSGATDVYITSNTMSACGGSEEMIHTPAAASYIYIQSNTMSYPCTTAALHNACRLMTIWGDHWLVENNDISHTTDNFIFAGSYHVIRNNTLHDFAGLGQSPTDCGTNSGNCHIDMAASETSVATTYNLFEHNTVSNALGTDTHGWLEQGDACAGACHDVIVRFNTGLHVGGGMNVNDNARQIGVSPGFYNVSSYNNTWADPNTDSSQQTGGITSAYTFNSTGGLDLNNLSYYTFACSNFNPVICSEGGAESTCSSFTSGYSLAYCTGGGTPKGTTYGSGLFTTTTGNVNSDPLFASYPSNLALSVGSPALATGGALTTANGAGAGSTQLTVNNDRPFSDGSGIVNGDYIAVGTVSNIAQIASINRATHVITLGSSLTWSNGASVWLKKTSDGTDVLTGAAPNMGALGVLSVKTLSASPASFSFGSQTATTTSSPQCTTVSSTGGLTVTISSISLLTGTAYAISSNNCGGTVASGSSCSVCVAFTPPTGIAYNDTLRIASDAAVNPADVTMTGTGTGPPATTAALDVNGHSEVSVCFGQSATLNWSVVGDTDLACSIDNGVGSLTITDPNLTTGSNSVSPVVTTTYTLSCSSTTGTASANVTVHAHRCGGPF